MMLVSFPRIQRMRGAMKGSGGGDKAAKAERTPGRHSRTGCGTCKKRRVKCDEEKPICRRCRKFGVGCDGYEAPPKPKSSTSTSTSITTTPNLLPRKIIKKDLQYLAITSGPSTALCENDAEQRYFLSFRNNTAYGTNPYIDPQTWRRMLLQASSEPAIRHAVIALGALEEWSSTVQDQGSSLVLHNQPQYADRLHQTAIQHYSKSISLMRKNTASGKNNLQIISLLSLVIICFESLHRNYALAGPQVYTGLALIQNGNSSESDCPTSPPSPGTDAVEHDLIRIFGRLEIQSMCFVDPRPTDFHKRLMKEGADRMQSMPAAFNSLDEAKEYMEILVRRAQRLIHLADALLGHGHARGSVSPPDQLQYNNGATDLSYGQPQTSPPGESYGTCPDGGAVTIDTSLHLQQLTPPKTPSYPATARGSSSPSPSSPIHDLSQNSAFHLHDINRWKSSFDGFLNQHTLELSNPSTTLLRIYYLVVYLATNIANPLPADPIYPVPPPNFTIEMSTIVNLCALLMPTLQDGSSPQSQIPTTTPSTFSFDLGVILPLYFVGLQCRDNSIRQRAIDLLLLTPARTEGVNNTIVAGKVAQWVKEIENEWLDGRGEVPSWAKASGLKVVFEHERRVARVKCVQGSVGDGSFGGDVVKRETTISW